MNSKLKLVVVSMSLLGIVSCPTIAAAGSKHKHHKAAAKQETVSMQDYKDMGSMPVCTVSQASMTMDEMTQSVNRAMPNPCKPGWFNRIQLSGGMNVDIGKIGNRNTNYQGENYQVFSLNDAYLNVTGNLNDWARAFASLSYGNPTTNANPSTFAVNAPTRGLAEYSAAYANNINSGAANLVQLEQAYATLGNPDVSPVFVQVGKGYQDFSRYDIHPITRSLTQVMSETLATALKVGFIANGFNGSASVFDTAINRVTRSTPDPVYNLALGYDRPCPYGLGWDLGAAYMSNMIGVNDVAYSVVNFNARGAAGSTGAYNTAVGAYALYGDINSGPFSLGARFTAASKRFNVNDLPQNGVAGLVGGTIAGAALPGATGAKPWALGVTGGYGFEGWGKTQNVYLGYQATSQAAGLNLPKNRWLVGYGIDMWKDTLLALEWDRDAAYNTANGGTGRTSSLVSFRAGVKFS